MEQLHIFLYAKKSLVCLRIASHLLQAPHVQGSQSVVRYPHNPDRKPSTTPIKNCPTTTNLVFQWCPTVRQPRLQFLRHLWAYQSSKTNVGILEPFRFPFQSNLGRRWDETTPNPAVCDKRTVSEHSILSDISSRYIICIRIFIHIPYSIQIFIDELEKCHCSLGFPNKSYQKQQCQDHKSHAASTKSSHLEFCGAFCQVMAAWQT